MPVIRRSGPSIADVVADLHDVPTRVMPYAAATALTKGAKRGQQAIIKQMPKSFRHATAYTLNATRIEVATKDKLFARIAVKDQRPGKGTRPESYLLPEVEGGGRSEKGLERLLRFKGILHSGEWAYPQSSSILDANGNVSASKVKSILGQLAKKGSPYFVGTAGKTHTRALWQRGPHEGGRTGKNQQRGIRAIMIFSRQAPRYSPRLDFVATADSAVRANFASDYYAAAQSLRRKFA